jgi:phage terminase large subunit-like protein
VPQTPSTTARAFGETGLSVAEEMAALSPEELDALMTEMEPQEALRLLYNWSIWGRPKQQEPPDDPRKWFVWLLLSGRGFGKTDTGAHWVRRRVESGRAHRIALIAETAADARDVLIEGPAGILAASPPWYKPTYEPSKRRITWPDGQFGITFSGEEPDQLRGPQFDTAWCDELAKYMYPQETWDNLELGLRLGDDPRACVTTTPRPIPIIKQMLEDPMVVVTRGSSYENVSNLATAFIKRVLKKYEGTRLGRQELHAEVLTDVPGALWNYDLLEATRVSRIPEMRRIVVGVDPAISLGEDADETGIVVVGKGVDDHGYVLRDVSGQYSPEQWGSLAAKMAREYKADWIVCEKNQGGLMVERTIKAVDKDVLVKGVWAKAGKATRAEPIAARYEQGLFHQFGTHAKMEDQMTSYVGDKEQIQLIDRGEMPSPDRMDAMVYAALELFDVDDVDYDPSKWKAYRR